MSLSLDGQEIHYIGMHVKRLPPTDSEFTVINAGESLSAVVDLSSIYAISERGNYQALYKGVTLSNAGLNSATGLNLKAVGGAFLNVIDDRPVFVLR